MEGLVEIKQWLHVWTEAERARRLGIKSPCTGSPDNGEGNPANRGEERKVVQGATLRGPLDLTLLALMQSQQAGGEVEADALSTPPAQNVAYMPLTHANSVSQFNLCHSKISKIPDQVSPFRIHTPYYRYRAMNVKRHSDLSAVHTKGMETLANRLKHARAKTRLNQTQLAKKAGLKNQSIIGSLESGHRKSSAYIPAIAQALGVSALWLATGKGPIHDTAQTTTPKVSEFDRKLWDQVVWLWNNADPEVMTMFRMMINAAYIKKQETLAQNMHDNGATDKPRIKLVESLDESKAGGAG